MVIYRPFTTWVNLSTLLCWGRLAHLSWLNYEVGLVAITVITEYCNDSINFKNMKKLKFSKTQKDKAVIRLHSTTFNLIYLRMVCVISDFPFCLYNYLYSYTKCVMCFVYIPFSLFIRIVNFSFVQDSRPLWGKTRRSQEFNLEQISKFPWKIKYVLHVGTSLGFIIVKNGIQDLN